MDIRTTSSQVSDGVSVLVLGYMARPHLEAGGAFQSILNAFDEIPGRKSLVYLDNYSRDGSVETLQRLRQDIDILVAPFNGLYCRGVNTLVTYSEAKYRPKFFILVDADNYARPNAYVELLRFMNSHPGVGMAQPLVLQETSGTVYSSGHQYTADHWCMPKKDMPPDDQPLFGLPSVSISSTIVQRAVFERCGLLDELYEIYYESADLGFRARSAGFDLACVPKSQTFNEGTEALGINSIHHRYYFNRNRILFWRIHNLNIAAKVEAESLERLEDLERRLLSSKWGLGPVDEGTRRGLRDGLRMANGLKEPRPIRMLGSFVKGSAIVAHESLTRRDKKA